MQVILLENIHHLGNLGDVVKVKDGYGRNFLIPQGHAKRATKAAIAEFETRRADLEKAQAERLANAQALQEKLNGATVTIASKAGVDGRLFGSVTNSDIAEAVDKLGFTIKKSQVRTPLGRSRSLCSPTSPLTSRFRSSPKSNLRNVRLLTEPPQGDSVGEKNRLPKGGLFFSPSCFTVII